MQWHEVQSTSDKVTSILIKEHLFGTVFIYWYGLQLFFNRISGNRNCHRFKKQPHVFHQRMCSWKSICAIALRYIGKHSNRFLFLLIPCSSMHWKMRQIAAIWTVTGCQTWTNVHIWQYLPTHIPLHRKLPVDLCGFQIWLMVMGNEAISTFHTHSIQIYSGISSKPLSNHGSASTIFAVSKTLLLFERLYIFKACKIHAQHQSCVCVCVDWRFH